MRDVVCKYCGGQVNTGGSCVRDCQVQARMNAANQQQLGISTHQELLLTVENLKKEIKMYEELTKVLKIQLTHERGKDNDLKERRRRVFEQVAIGYSIRDWKELDQQPSEHIIMSWANQTAEEIIRREDKFANKES